MTVTIPLQPLPSQRFNCTLSGQNCTLWIRKLTSGLYLDLWLNEEPLIMGALCLHDVDIIRNPASPLQGKLYFADTQGNAEPDYSGLGTRFILKFEDRTK